MTSESIVRPAVPEDKAEIWRLFRLLHQENAMFAICEPKVDYYIDRLLHPETIKFDDTGPRGFIGVIGPVGALEGCIMLTVGAMWYSDEFTLDEHLNFVDPEHRASNHAKALIDFAKSCSDKIGIKLVIGILSTHRTAAKVRLYSQKLPLAGAFFVYPSGGAQGVRPAMSMRADTIIVPAPKKKKRYRPHKWERMAQKPMQVKQ